MPLTKITGDLVDSTLKDGAAGVATMRSLGTGATQAAAGNDPRFGGGGGTPDLDAYSVFANITGATAPGASLSSAGVSAILVSQSSGPTLAWLTSAAQKPILLGPAGVVASAVTLSNTDHVTGTLPIGNGGTGATTAATARTSLGLGTISTQDANNVAITGGTITGMGTPSVSSDVATKGYVDALVAGLKWKQSVVVATTAAGTLASSFENGDTVDGVVLVTGDRILLKDQADPKENGIYTVNASGAPTRATDADAGTELVSAAVFVSSGTVNADKAFVCTPNAITLGVTNVVWTSFASVVGALIAANNLSDLTNTATARVNLGVEIGVNVQGFDATLAALALFNTNGILVQTAADTFTGRTITGTTDVVTVTNGDGVAGNPTITIAATYVGQTSITTLGTVTTGTWSATPIAVAKGGTGATDAAGARTNLGVAYDQFELILMGRIFGSN